MFPASRQEWSLSAFCVYVAGQSVGIWFANAGCSRWLKALELLQVWAYLIVELVLLSRVSFNPWLQPCLRYFNESVSLSCFKSQMLLSLPLFINALPIQVWRASLCLFTIGHYALQPKDCLVSVLSCLVVDSHDLYMYALE